MKKCVLRSLSFVVIMCLISSIGLFSVSAAPEGYFDVPVQNAGLEYTGGDDPLPGFMNESLYAQIENIAYEDYQYVEISTDYAHTGSKSLKIYDSEHGGSTRALTNNITVAQGEIYKASFWAYVPAGTVGNAPSGTTLNASQAKARFKAYHANGSEKAIGATVLIPATSVANGWVKYEIADYTIPTGLSYLKIEFYVDGSDYAVAYFDDIEIYKKGSEYTRSAIAQPRTYNKVVIENGGFESVTNKQWTLDARTTGGATSENKFEIVSDKRFEGNNSLYYYDKDSSGIITYVASKFFTALPGDTFRGSIKGYLNTAAGTEVAMYAKINFYNANKTLLSTASSDLYKKVNVLIKWGSYTFDEKTAPANTAFAQILFYNVAGNKSDSYIDKVELFSTGNCVVEPEPATFSDMTVLNNGFEDVTNGTFDNWELIGSELSETVNFEVATDIVHSGSTSLKVFDDSTTQAVMLATPMYKVQKEGTYEASSYIYNMKNMETGAGSRTLLFINEYDEAGREVKSNYVGAGSVAGDYTYNMWKEYSLTVTVLPQTKYIRVIVGCSAYWNALGAYFDDVTLKIMDREEYQYVGDVAITNTDGSAITSFTAGQDIKLSVDVENTLGASMPITLIVGIYNENNQLEVISFANNDAALLTSSTISTTITAPSDLAGKYIKVLIWENGFNAMKAYYSAETTSLS